MNTRPLGRTDLHVSTLCLGSMTWGEQNDESEAFAQLDAARAESFERARRSSKRSRRRARVRVYD